MKSVIRHSLVFLSRSGIAIKIIYCTVACLLDFLLRSLVYLIKGTKSRTHLALAFFVSTLIKRANSSKHLAINI
jgi:hypothetical protein